MTPEELEHFIERQLKFGARIERRELALKRALIKSPNFAPYVARKADGGVTLSGIAAKIFRSLKRPGVALSDRPRSADGGQTFHFAVTSVSKGSTFTRHIGGQRPGAAAAHESYIERDGAAESLEDEINWYQRDLGAETYSARGAQPT